MPTKRVAQPEEDLVRLYLNDVGKHALLTREDEVRLAQSVEAGRQARGELAGAELTSREAAGAEGVGVQEIAGFRKRELRKLIRDGDDATDVFVTANLRLVVSIAKKYRSSELPLLDLVQEGNVGLIHAVEKFDWRKGFKFSTYATWWIRQAISRGIANNGRTVRLPVHAGDLLMQVTKARGRLEGQLGRRPTISELAADLGVAENKVTEILRHSGEPASLSQPLWSEGDAELGDIVEDSAAVSPFDAAASALLVQEVSKILEVLDDREREILRLRFGLDRSEPRTLDEVGAHFNLTRERIRQIEAKAMSKLRHPVLGRQARELLTN